MNDGDSQLASAGTTPVPAGASVPTPSVLDDAALGHIGVAGVTIPGTLLCVQEIVAECARLQGRPGAHPRITMTNPEHERNEALMLAHDWDGLTALMLESVDVLARAGADFVVIPSNAPHFAIDRIQQAAAIPVVSIVAVTVAECVRRGFRTVGVLGVNTTVEDGLYDAPLRTAGMVPVRLSTERQHELDKLLHDEVINGPQTPTTHEHMVNLIGDLVDAGCDSFIAGCTEIPVVITSEDESPLPFVDTTRLLAHVAARRGLGLES
ncbi:MAG: amino acid racemase [Bifidobacterium sp.]|jgi:aspartate racemase|uniref:aspartate/glutamate racemase family protein n=1 Tax=Bifidobacterium sp. TaxID=41200 RepID=UPI00235789BD|nr:amino acid racemase [Bifidobacterium tibiigranuli]